MRGNIHREIMSVNRYRQFCADLDREMVIHGYRISLLRSKSIFTIRTIRVLREYFRGVLSEFDRNEDNRV